ncbi:MAG TPA: hypothetical protein PK002_03275 [Cellvibrio sp.]|nr:hypothetical protein [Cellvibrio sp.]
MTKTGYKNIFIALLLLAFTSQSFAALVMPCQFLSQASHSINMDDMAGMDHSGIGGMDHSGIGGMDHSNMVGMDDSEMASDIETDTNPMSDCCKTVGHCSSGSCSLALFGHSFAVSLPATQADLNVSFTSFIPESLISSLFRPPIFR